MRPGRRNRGRDARSPAVTAGTASRFLARPEAFRNAFDPGSDGARISEIEDDPGSDLRGFAWNCLVLVREENRHRIKQLLERFEDRLENAGVRLVRVDLSRKRR